MKQENVVDDDEPVRKKSSRKSWMSSEYVAIQSKFSSVVAAIALSVASSMLYIAIKSISSFCKLALLTLSANSRKIEFSVDLVA